LTKLSEIGNLEKSWFEKFFEVINSKVYIALITEFEAV